jgi:membrane protease YdiL (CAAX protease family)
MDDFTTPPPQSPPTSTTKNLFIGPAGLRAGWRLLIFYLILAAIAALFGTIVRFWTHGARPATPTTLTPLFLSRSEGLAFLFVCLATLIMMRIEHRPWRIYGLPWKKFLGKRFWEGTLWGFGAICTVLLAIFLLHGFQTTGLNIHGATIVTALAAWSFTFLVVGLSEEFTFRGYSLFTLGTGLRFWPAAIVMSILFGAAHAGNNGETPFGLFSVVLFGLLFCFFLRRTGDLWLAVGFHAGWDWGQTFFFGVHDSGFGSYHNLFNSTFHGANWLTGGSVGPEASVFTPIVLGLVALFFSRRFRNAAYDPPAAVRTPLRAPIPLLSGTASVTPPPDLPS